MSKKVDLVVVGAGIVGLAHALIARRRGLSVIVVDREAEAIGASVRNFGFVTVTGQQQGDCWRRAMRSRDIWQEVAPLAGIPVEHQGLLVVARRPEAMTVLEAFKATDMGAECRLIDAATLRRDHGAILADGEFQGGLWSPHERRVESRHAVGKLAAWIEKSLGAEFRRRTLVKAVEPGRVVTTDGVIEAERVVVCPGDDLLTLFPDRIAAMGITRCRLHMMKVMPADKGFRLPGSVMTDLSLVRYLGYSELPEAAPLRARLQAEQGEFLDNGIHLIAVQGSDGGLIVGDSHHYEWSPSPFARDRVDELMLDEMNATLRLPGAQVTERWMGTYASHPEKLMIMDAPDPAIRLVIVTSGTGASTAFAIAEETLTDLYGAAA
ncbi:TIGR03364 family FAD-dependent oxidoreductase [Tabrizicola sp. J26]|uniref:TIGR03364 family FAD-dependent oxidoreductase n=1 Tax=Alitabrizicola rongguiensis TaxID=2909234 RepID=UPI001F477561|nr:TIGR03364 family FAD-dependent oxidoreductase [Tabrizicola rongguiensis]MCF1710785.1 TIGR03364 family FAD-dependent oxidoreductase [Tabrizicola rongguiensis]